MTAKNGQVRGGFSLKWTSAGGNNRGRKGRKLLLNFN